MTGRRKLLLHVGLPKTGTSALQAWLRANAHTLRPHGIDYPDAFAEGEDKHQFLVGALRSGTFDTLGSVLAGSTSPTVILSSEGLSNHLDDFSDSHLARFRDCAAGFDTEILLITRARLPWLRSYYRQCIVNPANGASDLWATTLEFDDFSAHPRARRLTDHAGLTDGMKAAYAAGSVIRLAYEDDWFAGLKAALGLAGAALPPLPRNNDSVPDWVVLLMLEVNRSHAPETVRRAWRAALQAHLGTSHSVFTQSWHPDWRRDTVLIEPRIIGSLAAAIAARDPGAAESLNRFAAFLGDAAGSPEFFRDSPDAV
ncbi:hypothetical protein DFR52_104406 [Hoeflea marina]|uniref:Sulfotransferase family protein n=1 Tax=Hoeflea marina TaxID=274592 RepID=A0A317PGF9_9HYPH|nr:hypothetical protein [Hoeflea marina]PWV99114.1 hypothetical protein DFR52_104406 [Hoeflea marina]